MTFPNFSLFCKSSPVAFVSFYTSQFSTLSVQARAGTVATIPCLRRTSRSSFPSNLSTRPEERAILPADEKLIKENMIHGSYLLQRLNRSYRVTHDCLSARSIGKSLYSSSASSSSSSSFSGFSGNSSALDDYWARKAPSPIKLSCATTPGFILCESYDELPRALNPPKRRVFAEELNWQARLVGKFMRLLHSSVAYGISSRRRLPLSKDASSLMSSSCSTPGYASIMKLFDNGKLSAILARKSRLSFLHVMQLYGFSLDKMVFSNAGSNLFSTSSMIKDAPASSFVDWIEATSVLKKRRHKIKLCKLKRRRKINRRKAEKNKI